MQTPIQLTSAYAQLIAELERACFESYWDLGTIRAELERDSSFSFGVIEDHKLLAYTINYMVLDELHVLRVGVDPNHRRRGLAKLLLNHTLKKAGEADASSAYLEVRASNEAAISLYESVGFERVGKRKAYYSDTGEDALLLAKVFVKSSSC